MSQPTRQRPSLVVFDVNETLSDMTSMGDRFEEVGAPAHLAPTWFAGVLRDGFALTVNGAIERFADIGEHGLRSILSGVSLTREMDDAVRHVMAGFLGLGVHPDVSDGIRALRDLDIRLVTLSNGSASVAERLLEGAGLREQFERLMSVEQAGIWKPAPGAYGYALSQAGVDPGDAMLVAVHPWDIDGARRAGLSTAWINREGGPYPGSFLGPDIEAASLVELADKLR